jgi:hypothetical protein
MAKHNRMRWGQICANRIKREKDEEVVCVRQAGNAHFLWIWACSSSTVGRRSSSLSRRSIFSLLSCWSHHHEGVADVLNRALGDGKGREARGVCLVGRADEPLVRSWRERRKSNEVRSGDECWRNMGAPGRCGSTGVSNGRTAGARLERDAMGSVTRGRLRSKEGEPDRGIGGGTAFWDHLGVEVVGVGRGDVRASCKFSMGSAGGDIGWGPEHGTEESGGVERLVLPNQRKIGCGGLWGGCCELGGSAGMFRDKWRSKGHESNVVRKRRAVAATLLEVGMSGSER